MYGGSGIRRPEILDVHDPAPVTTRLPETHRPDLLSGAGASKDGRAPPRCRSSDALDEAPRPPHRGAPEVQARRHDARVVDDHELGAEHVR